MPIALEVFIETVLISVQFDDQSSLETYEIHDISAQRLLAFEFEIGKPPAAQPFPENGLGLGAGFSKFSGEDFEF